VNDIRDMAESAHQVFEKNGWEWLTAENGIPTVDEIEKTIQELIALIEVDDETQWVATGHLKVEREVWKEEGIEPFVSWNYYLELSD
jgi:hypothetical protein